MGPWERAARYALGRRLVVAGACAAVVICAAPALGRSRAPVKAAPSCPPKHTPVTAKTGSVAVYAEDTGTDPFSGGTVTTYYACPRPKGQPVTIGESVASGGEYPANAEMEDVRIAGTFVTDEGADGFASAAACGKYEPPDACNGIVKYWVEIADVAARRTVKVFLSGPVSALALSPKGATAWVVSTPASSSSSSPTSTLYATAVHPAGPRSLSARPTVIDSGQAITSVSFAGSLLRWRNGGQPKSKTIS